jgi:hypothetical protein
MVYKSAENLGFLVFFVFSASFAQKIGNYNHAPPKVKHYSMYFPKFIAVCLAI